jgi:chromosome partitioning protein
MNKLRTIGIVNQKGGCGKTTTVINALDFFSRAGYKVVLVDADRQQSSATSAKQLGLPYQTAESAKELIEKIANAKEQYDLVIIDGPGSIDEINRTILNRVDLAIMPSKASAFDIEGTRNTIVFLEDSQRNSRIPPVGVVYLNDVIDNSLILGEAQEYFRNNQPSITLLDEHIPNRVCIADIAAQGETIYQMRGRMPKEMARKYNRLFEQALQVYENTQILK